MRIMYIYTYKGTTVKLYPVLLKLKKGEEGWLSYNTGYIQQENFKNHSKEAQISYNKIRVLISLERSFSFALWYQFQLHYNDKLTIYNKMNVS